MNTLLVWAILATAATLPLPAAAQDKPGKPAETAQIPAWQRDVIAHTDRMARIAGVRTGARRAAARPRPVRSAAPPHRHAGPFRSGSLWLHGPSSASVRPLRSGDDFFRRRYDIGSARSELRGDGFRYGYDRYRYGSPYGDRYGRRW